MRHATSELVRVVHLGWLLRGKRAGLQVRVVVVVWRWGGVVECRRDIDVGIRAIAWAVHGYCAGGL